MSALPDDDAHTGGPRSPEGPQASRFTPRQKGPSAQADDAQADDAQADDAQADDAQADDARPTWLDVEMLEQANDEFEYAFSNDDNPCRCRRCR